VNCGLFDLKCKVDGMFTGWARDATNWVDGIFPFGWYGVWFILGVIAGERLGKWAYAGIIAFIAYRFIDRKQPERHENVDDEAPVARRKPSSQKPPPGKRTRTIFDQLGKR
jgi:hypothetical protein